MLKTPNMKIYDEFAAIHHPQGPVTQTTSGAHRINNSSGKGKEEFFRSYGLLHQTTLIFEWQ
jgi:hypothetical protein